MDSGKRFEQRFASALHELPGASMRIEDGGAVAKNYQYGDFFYFADDGNTYLIECKATRLPSFEVRNLRETQIAMLTRWQETHPQTRHAVIAINFYGDNYRKENDCLLVTLDAYKQLHARAREAGRASIPRVWLEHVGRTQAHTREAWALDFGGLIHGTL